jgi:hypothetical protein
VFLTFTVRDAIDTVVNSALAVDTIGFMFNPEDGGPSMDTDPNPELIPRREQD